MASKEVTRNSIMLFGTNRLVKTSYKHTRHITIKPDLSLIENPEIIKEISASRHIFFQALNETTNYLADRIKSLNVGKAEKNRKKSFQISSLHSALASLRDSLV